MNYKFTFFSLILLLLLLSIAFTSCHFDTEKIIDKTNKLLPNGKHLAIEKTTSLTTATGILSNYSYSLSHSFLYKMAINPGDIDWEGGSAEPKEILFNEDKIYLHSLKEKELNIPTNDSITENMFANYELEIVHYYEQHIDKRYFFKLLGDDFWTEITTEEYSEAKKSGQVYAIPNDNELTVPSTIFDVLQK